MTTIAIKKEMHQAIDVINDTSFLKAIYTLLNEKSKEYNFELNSEQKKELEKRQKSHRSGKSKSYSFAEVKKYALSRSVK